MNLELIFFGRFNRLRISGICGDGVPLMTAPAGLMTPTAQASMAVESLPREEEPAAKRVFSCLRHGPAGFGKGGLRNGTCLHHRFSLARIGRSLRCHRVPVISSCIRSHNSTPQIPARGAGSSSSNPRLPRETQKVTPRNVLS